MQSTRKGPSRKLYGEGGVSKLLLGDFKIEGSKGLEFLLEYLGIPFEFLYVNILRSVGEAFSIAAGIPFPRNFKRNKALLIKWFDDNIDEIYKQKSNVKLIFKCDLPIENEKIVLKDKSSDKENEDISTKQNDDDIFSTLFQQDDDQNDDFYYDLFLY